MWIFGERIPSGRARFNPRPAQLDARLIGLILIKSYEGPEIHLIDRFLRPDLDVLELGSSIGLSSAHIARKLYPQRTLVCVEPNATLHPSIRSNVRLNGPNTDLCLVHAALFDRDEADVALEIGDEAHVSRLGSGPTSTTVPGRSLGSLIEEFLPGEFSLVCDIEGAERFFILDSRPEELHACRQMLIELHDSTLGGRPVGVDELAANLTSRHGFETVTRIRNVLLLERAAVGSSRHRV
jgi:FkbM family methyltransferase